MVKVLIAVVDDDVSIRDSLKFSLEVDGFRVHAFANGGELLRDLGLDKFRCLVSDYRLPDMSGVELVERLRRLGANIPCILALSGPNGSAVRRAAAAGVVLIEKTQLAESLADVVRSAVARCPPAEA